MLVVLCRHNRGYKSYWGTYADVVEVDLLVIRNKPNPGIGRYSPLRFTVRLVLVFAIGAIEYRGYSRARLDGGGGV